MKDYWRECIAEAFEDAGIKASDEQIDTVTSWVEGAYENKSTALGYDAISSPSDGEIKRLKRELQIERSKIQCSECKGRGWIVTRGPYHSSESQCHKCRGDGRVKP